MRRPIRGSLIPALVLWAVFSAPAAPPKSLDHRIQIDLFAEHPLVVTPTGITVDDHGRVFVAESHTHFRPKDYKGPPADRILVLEDTNGDGRADRKTVFHEGFTHVMDIELHHDGSLYVATRMDIHRLWDTDGDKKADKVTPIVRMDTKGDYPHNGLSGIAFHFDGSFSFGLGENLGEPYTLIGSDGRKLSGGGEGGSTYHVRTDGSNLRRVSTGWWNPFGMCVDAFDRVFGTDNDPDMSPPCRLFQVVEGADFGYEYRHGRTGLNPLTSWTGDIKGNLPMLTGTGEAPCALEAYESDALPADYRGRLIVAAWSDRRIEHYPIRQEHARGLVSTARQVMIEGDLNFRPVGVAVAPDGTLYISDWVSTSYDLHSQGRVWRIRPTKMPARRTPAANPLAATDRRMRERAARGLLETSTGRRALREGLRSPNDRVRATALLALSSVHDAHTDFATIAKQDESTPIRVIAARSALSTQKIAPSELAGPEHPTAVRTEAVAHLNIRKHGALLAGALTDGDPLLFHAGVMGLARAAERGEDLKELLSNFPVPVLLGLKRSARTRAAAAKELARHLDPTRPDVCYLAVKWIADDKLTAYRSHLDALFEKSLNHRLFVTVSAALQVLEGKKPDDVPSAGRLLARVTNKNALVATRRAAMRLLAPNYKGLRIEHLMGLAAEPHTALRLEAVRTLAGHPDPARFGELKRLAKDEGQPEEVRLAAIHGLAGAAEKHAATLLAFVSSKSPTVRDEALRALVGVPPTPKQRALLKTLPGRFPQTRELVTRLQTGRPGERPPLTDFDAWMELIAGEGRPTAGERIFFGAKLGQCSTCHQYDGRGTAVGPNLTRIHHRLRARGADGKRWLLETILQPSREMAPQYTPWTIITRDGEKHTGLPRRKGGGSEVYLGLDGKEFKIKESDIAISQESKTSIMPEDLLTPLTVQEVRDLLAFLMGGAKRG